MEQVRDFLEECDALADAASDLPAADWGRPTQFKGWTPNDVIVHLVFWNRAADRSLFEPQTFAADMPRFLDEIRTSGIRAMENRAIPERGSALFAVWQTEYRDMAHRWEAVDPKTRVRWVGPEMSARSSMSARQMETWAHGQEIFDLLGRERVEHDRIRNIVFLAINAFGFAHRIHGLDVPAAIPRLVLTAPSGAVWTFGEDESAGRVEGSAVEFAQVQTQTRNVADTALSVRGPVAERWMQIAQCFAGPPETPPAPGTRFRTER